MLLFGAVVVVVAAAAVAAAWMAVVVGLGVGVRRVILCGWRRWGELSGLVRGRWWVAGVGLAVGCC